MASKAIATIRCGICRSEKARVSVSAKGLAVVTCNACHCQTFARSDVSDRHIRDNMAPLPVLPVLPVLPAVTGAGGNTVTGVPAPEPEAKTHSGVWPFI